MPSGGTPGRWERDVSEAGDGEFLGSPELHLAPPALQGMLKPQQLPSFSSWPLEIGVALPTKAAHTWWDGLKDGKASLCPPFLSAVPPDFW